MNIKFKKIKNDQLSYAPSQSKKKLVRCFIRIFTFKKLTMSLYQTLYDYALTLKVGTEPLIYGRDLIRNWAISHVDSCPDKKPRILDIGCGQGNDLTNIRDSAHKSCELFGVDFFKDHIGTCEKKGIAVATINVERDIYPYEDSFFDVIIANQIIEHTKDTFYVLAEISRILKKGGICLIGIPNLAAWHDRLILLWGQQPSGSKMMGPHIRGMTRPALQQFVECDGFFALHDFKGSGFYPFPKTMSKILARYFPSLATCIFFNFRRTDKEGTFIEVLKSRTFETNYYTGE